MDLKLQTDIANHVANFKLDSDVINTHAGGHGSIQLNGDYYADAVLDTQTIPIAPLIAIYVPSQAGAVTGETELHATLRGPLKDKTRIEAHLVVPRLALDYKDSIHLAAEAPIRADYANGTLSLQRSTIRGTGTEVTFQASVPAAKDAPVSMLVQGSVDLQLAQLMSPDISSGGELRFDIDSNGRRSDPNVQGQIRIINASFATADAPLGLQGGNGVLTLTRDRLDVTQFQGKVGGGAVTASGGIVYRPQVQFDLAMAAEGVRVLYDQSVRTTLNSKLALTGTYENALLSGQVGVDQLSFTSDFDISDLMSQFGGVETPPPAQGFGQDLSLDIGIETPGGINLTSRTLSLAGAANLHVRGTAAQPVLLGRAEPEQRRPDLFRQSLQASGRDDRFHQSFTNPAGSRYGGENHYRPVRYSDALLGTCRPSAYELRLRSFAASVGHHQSDCLRENFGSGGGKSYSARCIGSAIADRVPGQQPDHKPRRKTCWHFPAIG